MTSMMNSELEAQCEAQATRFASALHHKAANGIDVVVESEGGRFLLTVWSDHGRQRMFSQSFKTLNRALSSAAEWYYSR